MLTLKNVPKNMLHKAAEIFLHHIEGTVDKHGLN